jgi:threonine/homoserine/homoserine lactone efflux protein
VSGQWLSDFIYMALVFWGSSYIRNLQNDSSFNNNLSFYLGSGGAIFLVLLGSILLLTKPVQKNAGNLERRKLSGIFLQGFLINTLTPFPIFFWISLMSSAIGRHFSTLTSFILLATVMSVVILTDLLKVYTAKKISRSIRTSSVTIIRKIAGLALILSGILLFIRIFILK